MNYLIRSLHLFAFGLILLSGTSTFCASVPDSSGYKRLAEDIPDFDSEQYQETRASAIKLGELAALRDQAYKQTMRTTNQQEHEADIRRAVQDEMLIEQTVKEEKLKEANKNTAFQHAKLAGALAAATTIGHDQYMAQEKTIGSSVLMGAHNGITRASSALINAAIVAGVTYAIERAYQYFAGTPEQKTLPPAIINALVRKKQQEMLSKEKIILNADVKALKEQSAILALQCANANTPEQKKLCDAMREAILKQNLMHLAKRTQLDHAVNQAEEDEDEAAVAEPTEPAKKPEQKNETQQTPTAKTA